jgi:cytoskeletal protein RodZ
MKKNLAVILASLLLLAGCAAKTEEKPTTETPKTENATSAVEPEVEPEPEPEEEEEAEAEAEAEAKAEAKAEVEAEPETEPEAEEEIVAVESFEGAYAEKGYEEITSYMLAEIEGDTIHIYMFSETDESSILYWTGSFEQPEGRAEYSFDSVNNKEESDFALFASKNETKTFTIKGGDISFSGSMLGMTKTFHLVKVTP